MHLKVAKSSYFPTPSSCSFPFSILFTSSFPSLSPSPSTSTSLSLLFSLIPSVPSPYLSFFKMSLKKTSLLHFFLLLSLFFYEMKKQFALLSSKILRKIFHSLQFCLIIHMFSVSRNIWNFANYRPSCVILLFREINFLWKMETLSEIKEWYVAINCQHPT